MNEECELHLSTVRQACLNDGVGQVRPLTINIFIYEKTKDFNDVRGHYRASCL